MKCNPVYSYGFETDAGIKHKEFIIDMNRFSRISNSAKLEYLQELDDKCRMRGCESYIQVIFTSCLILMKAAEKRNELFEDVKRRFIKVTGNGDDNQSEELGASDIKEYVAYAREYRNYITFLQSHQ